MRASSSSGPRARAVFLPVLAAATLAAGSAFAADSTVQFPPPDQPVVVASLAADATTTAFAGDAMMQPPPAYGVVVVPPPPPPPDRWQFQAAPYLWMTNLRGDIAVAPRIPPADVDIPFSTILHHLDFGFMGIATAQKGRFGLLADVVYASLSGDEAFPLRRGAGEATADIKLLISTTDVLWRVYETPEVTLDVLGGARVNHWKAELGITDTTGAQLNREGSQTWADPVAGLRGTIRTGQSTWVKGYVDVGGWVNSDRTWLVFLALEQEIQPGFSLGAGWRWYGMDHSNGPFLLDIQMMGPVLGASWQF